MLCFIAACDSLLRNTMSSYRVHIQVKYYKIHERVTVTGILLAVSLCRARDCAWTLLMFDWTACIMMIIVPQAWKLQQSAYGKDKEST